MRIKVLIIQLARLGDTIQSLMALRAAKQLYPQIEITFVARSSFADAVSRVPWIEEVISLPTQELLSGLILNQKTETETVAAITKWATPLVKTKDNRPWDFVFNWSYSESSSFLTALVPAKIKLGFSRRQDLSHTAIDGWSQYIQSVVQDLVEQNIHLTDILTTQLLTALQIHLGDPADAGNAPVTSKSFFDLKSPSDCMELSAQEWQNCGPLVDSTRRWIGIQLGAGHESKTWPVAYWAELISTLLEEQPHYGIVLLGSKAEKDKEIELYQILNQKRKTSKNLISLIGKSSFDLWASVTAKCQWIIAADTSIVHLASVLGTRVFNISVGPVRYRETGPYGNSHFVIRYDNPEQACKGCDLGSRNTETHECRTQLKPQEVYTALEAALEEWVPTPKEGRERIQTLRLQNSTLYKSRIRTPGEGGGVTYENVNETSLIQNDEWSGQILGHIARSWFCGWVPSIASEVQRNRLSPHIIKRARALDDAAQVLSRICNEGKNTSLELRSKALKLRSQTLMNIQERQELTDLNKKITELESLILRLGKTDPVLRAFSNLYRVLMHNLQGVLIQDLARETAECFEQIKSGAEILREWAQATLKLARPVAITPVISIKPKKEGPSV